jgi:hypothetical protein
MVPSNVETPCLRALPPKARAAIRPIVEREPSGLKNRLAVALSDVGVLKRLTPGLLDGLVAELCEGGAAHGPVKLLPAPKRSRNRKIHCWGRPPEIASAPHLLHSYVWNTGERVTAQCPPGCWSCRAAEWSTHDRLFNHEQVARYLDVVGHQWRMAPLLRLLGASAANGWTWTELRQLKEVLVAHLRATQWSLTAYHDEIADLALIELVRLPRSSVVKPARAAKKRATQRALDVAKRKRDALNQPLVLLDRQGDYVERDDIWVVSPDETPVRPKRGNQPIKLRTGADDAQAKAQAILRDAGRCVPADLLVTWMYTPKTATGKRGAPSHDNVRQAFEKLQAAAGEAGGDAGAFVLAEAGAVLAAALYLANTSRDDARADDALEDWPRLKKNLEQAYRRFLDERSVTGISVQADFDT